MAVMASNADDKSKGVARFELVTATSALMPGGQPQFKEIASRAPIAILVETMSRADMIKHLYVLINDFCSSLNVVRNMSHDQMIDAAAMLLDECGDFRLEDYMVMFTLAKRGQLVKIMDRIDISIIGQMMDAYYAMRRAEGQQIQEGEYYSFEQKIHQRGVEDIQFHEDNNAFGKLVGIMTAWQGEIDEEKEAADAAFRQKQVEGYATLQNINLEEIQKQFSKTPKRDNDDSKPSAGWDRAR
jgi:hypothetical protein